MDSFEDLEVKAFLSTKRLDVGQSMDSLLGLFVSLILLGVNVILKLISHFEIIPSVVIRRLCQEWRNGCVWGILMDDGELALVNTQRTYLDDFWFFVFDNIDIRVIFDEFLELLKDHLILPRAIEWIMLDSRKVILRVLQL